mgnify:CR=1|jgi:hypothetical protein
MVVNHSLNPTTRREVPAELMFSDWSRQRTTRPYGAAWPLASLAPIN